MYVYLLRFFYTATGGFVKTPPAPPPRIRKHWVYSCTTAQITAHALLKTRARGPWELRFIPVDDPPGATLRAVGCESERDRQTERGIDYGPPLSLQKSRPAAQGCPRPKDPGRLGAGRHKVGKPWSAALRSSYDESSYTSVHLLAAVTTLKNQQQLSTSMQLTVRCWPLHCQMSLALLSSVRLSRVYMYVSKSNALVWGAAAVFFRAQTSPLRVAAFFGNPNSLYIYLSTDIIRWRTERCVRVWVCTFCLALTVFRCLSFFFSLSLFTNARPTWLSSCFVIFW